MRRRSTIAISPVRARGGDERATMRPFAPLPDDHPSVGQLCAVCGCMHVAGDVVTVIPLGPGADEEHQARALDGRWYTCLGVVGHAACAGVEVPA